ncbi:hypothetical protein N7532_007035 [Penicillium argentinense]|uniref:Glycosyl hydrolase family 31 C-terminal domain-containing protein n=1 Tax=Penicillium argentinense TaxID=1131581 RepID=A0A9W9KBD1_9EURO|nr:uncharacterized protein N7532_007035 [Penicillium argentinense]KAJ5100034.1 hypothetical protein N7532_007035 [Penicillium argentinense]
MGTTDSPGAGDENALETCFFGQEAVDIVGPFMRQRYRLLPYIIQQAHASPQASKAGLPMVRSLIREYLSDRNVWNLEGLYTFGFDLLLAPTLQPLEETNTHSIHLPEGVWYGFWDKKKYESRGQWFEFPAAILSQNHVFVKGGTHDVLAQPRWREYNEVDAIDKVDVYGCRDGPWACGDDQNGLVEVVNDAGRWRVINRANV